MARKLIQVVSLWGLELVSFSSFRTPTAHRYPACSGCLVTAYLQWLWRPLFFSLIPKLESSGKTQHWMIYIIDYQVGFYWFFFYLSVFLCFRSTSFKQLDFFFNPVWHLLFFKWENLIISIYCGYWNIRTVEINMIMSFLFVLPFLHLFLIFAVSQIHRVFPSSSYFFSHALTWN